MKRQAKDWVKQSHYSYLTKDLYPEHIKTLKLQQNDPPKNVKVQEGKDFKRHYK